MPRRIRLIGRWGNGLLCVVNVLFALFSLRTVPLGVTLGFLAVAALGAFNVYVIEKAASFTAEEEWLKAEVRKAELRHQLAILEPGADHAARPEQHP